MLKYVDTLVTFSEVPDEISLCINISGCPFKCEGCHSSYLQEDTGEPLDLFVLYDLIEKNKGISCVCFMGGEPFDILHLARKIKHNCYPLRAAWYTGYHEIPELIKKSNCIEKYPYLDYIKIGSYDKKAGPLTSPTTNQRLYHVKSNDRECELEDITYKFWEKKASGLEIDV